MNWTCFSLLILAFSNSLLIALAESDHDSSSKKFQLVTCGSAIKLTHIASGYKLHSHNVGYGSSGSGQQSVTGFQNPDDANSLWNVNAAFGDVPCSRGAPIRCDSEIRLSHLNTNHMLHSHHHQSPLSNNQEVSGYEKTDSGDNWIVQCEEGSDFWSRDSRVRFQHKDTKKYLQADSYYKYSNPIPGQIEVSAVGKQNQNTVWMAQEGIYFSTMS